MGAAEAIRVVGDTWEAIQPPTVNPRTMKAIGAAAGATTTKAGTAMAEITIGVATVEAGTTKTASYSYAGKLRLSHVPGVGA